MEDYTYVLFDIVNLLFFLLVIWVSFFIAQGIIGERTETEYLKSMDDYLMGFTRSNTDFILRYTNSGYYTAYRIRKNGTLKLVKYYAEKTIISDSLPEGDRPYAEVVTYGCFNRIIKNTLYVPKGTVIQGRK